MLYAVILDIYLCFAWLLWPKIVVVPLALAFLVPKQKTYKVCQMVCQIADSDLQKH